MWHSPSGMLRWSLLAVAYASMAALALFVSEFWFDRPAWAHPEPWFDMPKSVAHVYSAALGIALGGLVVVVTRRLVERATWAQELARALKPFARDLTGTGIVVVAVLSSVGEEFLFRGLLEPWLGLWLQAVLFGLLHQMRGPSRWAWAVWAGIVGLLFGVLFVPTGSFVGPILAHAVINGFNLNYLQSHDPELPRRGLGGLLGQRSRA